MNQAISPSSSTISEPLWCQGDFSISTDKSKLNFEVIYQFLSTAYWSKGIPESVVKASIDGAMCFGVYHQKQQVGFARMITDQATFAYLADVFIIEDYRGQGLSKHLMGAILAHPKLQNLRRIVLATADAHELYRQYGFTQLNEPARFMHLHTPDIYRRQKNVDA